MPTPRRNTHSSTGRGTGNIAHVTLGDNLWGASQMGGSNKNRGAHAQVTPGGTGSTRPASASSASSILGSIASVVLGVLKTIGRILIAALGALFKLLRHLFGLLAVFLKKSHVARIVCAVVLAVVVLLSADTALNWGKAYPGVKVGSIDVGGMSIEDIETIVNDMYNPLLMNSQVKIYANEQALQSQATNPEFNDDMSVEQVRAGTVVWETDADTLQARLDAHTLAQEAVDVGRNGGGFFDRLGSLFGGWFIPVRADYNMVALDSLGSDIDLTIGTPHVDSSVSIQDGKVSSSPGSDGVEVDRSVLRDELDGAFFGNDELRSFVAHAEYAPMRITPEMAADTAAHIEGVISNGITFAFGDDTWNCDAATLGSLIRFENDTLSDPARLIASFDENKTTNLLVSHFGASSADGGKISVKMDNSGANPIVMVENAGTMPLAPQVIEKLDTLLEVGNTGDSNVVTVDQQEIPKTMSVDSAIEYGVITCISEYETEYTPGVVARNTNIHLAADLLNDSVIEADGGVWSFNDTAGECNEEKGFLAAGAIVGNESVDEIGGGICQVATTVFNTVYLSGFPVTQRTPHSFYIGSYPAGRDAAVSWPDLDLKWKNDSSSDVLLRMSYTDSTVTAKLYGVNPNYQVSSEVGEWREGDSYSTVTQTDSSYPAGTTMVKQSGADGRMITVTRTVADENGKVLHTDVFDSVYNAKPKIVVEGTG